MNSTDNRIAFDNEPARTVRNVPESESVANGPVLILLIMLLFGVLWGMYQWFVRLDQTTPLINTGARPTAIQNREPESEKARADVEAYSIVSPSDELPAIEADVESTDLQALESELDVIEAELNTNTETTSNEPATEPTPIDSEVAQ